MDRWDDKIEGKERKWKKAELRLRKTGKREKR
jgi:hypothetical protein